MFIFPEWMKDRRTMRWFAVLLASAVLLTAIPVLAMAEESSDYPMFHYDAQRTGNVSGDAPMTDQIVWSTYLGGMVGSSPSIADGKVFVSNWFAEWSGGVNGLYCLNETTGEILWNNSLSGSGGASTAAISDDKLFIGSLAGNLYCINASRGDTIWNRRIEHSPAYWGVASSPLVYENMIVVTTFSNNASNNGTLHVLDFNGSELWNISTGDTFYYTSPAAANGNIFFAGNLTSHSLFCVNIVTKEIQWRFNTSTQLTSTPAISDNTIFFASADRLYAVNAADGTELWNNSLSCVMSSPAVSYGKVYIGSSDSKLYCYDAHSGAELWSFSTNGPIYSSPLIAHNTVYFGTNTANGTIYALNTADGTLRWSYSLNPPSGSYYNIMSSPAVSDEILFFGADDGKVYAFGPKPAITAKIRIEGKNETIWSGEVTLSNSTIIDTNGTSHYIPYPSALGALNEASNKGNFSYEVVYYPEYDALYVKSIENDSEWWHYWVNYTLPMVGAEKYELKEGDSVLWGYSESWTPSPLIISLEKESVKINETFNVTVFNVSTNITTPLENATVYVDSLNYTTNEEGTATISLDEAGLYDVYAEKERYIRSEKEKILVLPNIATIKVRIEGKNATIWTGKVTFSNSTIMDTENVSHYLDQPTALGAVDAASKLGNFSYEVENQTWGLFLKSISGEAYDPATWDGWMYRVDYYSPMLGPADFILNQTVPPTLPHDEVLWYYGSWNEVPLKITLDKASVKVNEQFTATVESYNDTSGVWDPVDNASVYEGSSNYTTNINGSAVISISSAGFYNVYAEKEGYIRSEKKSVTVSPDDGGGGGNGISYWWSGSITLPSGTFTKTAFNTNKTYTINWCTALGALQKASEVDRFSYEIEETTWGPFVYSIADKKKYDEGETSGWMYQVNRETPMVGAHEYSVKVDDEIVWYFSKSMDTTPSTSSKVLKIKIISSSGDLSGSDGGSSPTPTPTPTPAPTKMAEETKTIEFIEAGGNASLTFNKAEITRVVINANSTIRTAEITVEQLEKPLNITNVSGIPYCYFNVTTTNLTDTNMTNATIEFKVNKTWINERNMDEATITLNRYSDMNNNWSALPTSKIEEDTTSLYFASETPGFSLFAISGHEKPAYLATGAETEAGTKPPMSEATAAPNPAPAPRAIPTSASVPKIPMSLIVIIIAIVAIAGMIIAVLKRK